MRNPGKSFSFTQKKHWNGYERIKTFHIVSQTFSNCFESVLLLHLACCLWQEQQRSQKERAGSLKTCEPFSGGRPKLTTTVFLRRNCQVRCSTWWKANFDAGDVGEDASKPQRKGFHPLGP